MHLAGLSPAVGNRVRMVTRVWEDGARARARVHKLRRIPSGDGRRGIGCYPSPCLTDGLVGVVGVGAGLCRSWRGRLGRGAPCWVVALAGTQHGLTWFHPVEVSAVAMRPLGGAASPGIGFAALQPWVETVRQECILLDGCRPTCQVACRQGYKEPLGVAAIAGLARFGRSRRS